MNTDLIFLHKKLEAFRDIAWSFEEFFEVSGSIERSMLYGEIALEVERDRREVFTKLTTKDKSILAREQIRLNDRKNSELISCDPTIYQESLIEFPVDCI